MLKCYLPFYYFLLTSALSNTEMFHCIFQFILKDNLKKQHNKCLKLYLLMQYLQYSVYCFFFSSTVTVAFMCSIWLTVWGKKKKAKTFYLHGWFMYGQSVEDVAEKCCGNITKNWHYSILFVFCLVPAGSMLLSLCSSLSSHIQLNLQ